MRAAVKVAYFDNSGLHKPGEIVEVKKITSYLTAIEEVAEPTEEVIEPIKPKRKKKKG